MLEIVWNSEEKSLASILRAHICQADRIDIAVAFLNSRGSSLIKNERGFESMGRADHFLSFVYFKIKREKHSGGKKSA